MYLAKQWWHTDAESGKVVCTLCPRHCKIPEGKRGFCFVRANVDGKLVLTTWGRSSGFCIDPIEKKPLNHFLPGTPVMSLGTAGCNLGCKFCQNWDISKSREMDTLASIATPEAIVDAAEETGCRSIAFTYNDPVIWAEYAIDIAKIARPRGIKTVAVTAGYIEPDARETFFEHMDAANIDIKAFTESFYRRLTQTHIQPVLDTIKWVKKNTNVWIELTNLVIPGENDSESEIAEMCKWLVDEVGDDVPLHFSAFHPDFKMMDKPRTPHATLIRARRQAMDAGVKYAYVGNVYDLANESTYCHNCGKCLIERDWYELGQYHLTGPAGNQCEYCGTVIPGVFDPPGANTPGKWGRKRQPVAIREEQVQLDRKLASLGFETVGHDKPDLSEGPDDSGAQSDTAATEEATGESGPSERSGLPERSGLDDSPTKKDAPRIDFTDAQAAVIVNHARALVRASVLGTSVDSKLPKEIAEAPAWGMFVTLERGPRKSTQLRGCRGSWGSISPLANMLARVATDTATCDARFPAIEPRELDYLSVDVTLMYDPQVITASGESRADCVEVGTHGLVIAHPRGRGLLLPQVAVERGWDARTFLEQVCLKANLPKGAWRDPLSQLMTFRGRVIEQPAPAHELSPSDLDESAWRHLIDIASRALHDEPIDDAQEHDERLARKHPHELGVNLHSASGLSSVAAGVNQSVIELAKLAGQSLRRICMEQRKGAIDDVAAMTLLYQPIVLMPQDYPTRHQLLARHAVLARANSSWSLALPAAGPGGGDDVVGRAIAAVRLSSRDWHAALAKQGGPSPRITAFSTHTVRSMLPRKATKIDRTRIADRPAARAGMFYPADAAAAEREIEQHLIRAAPGSDGRTPNAGKTRYPAIMLPHAGWRFCGDTLAKVLAKAHIPDTVIIIGPKHTPHGAQWSIAPQRAWRIPGATIPIDTELVDRLVALVPELTCEPDAHRVEHGAEVLLPFLHHMNPNIRIVPIVLGASDYESTGRLAEALAAVLADWPADREPPLLVISSDMNHFAPEPENRRRDFLAVNAMRTGDPRRLYDTCIDNNISMCGMLPAVTIMQALLRRKPTLDVELIDYTNSAEASGDTSSVVGYAGVVMS